MSSNLGLTTMVPSGSPKSSESVLSVSVSLQEQVESILTSLSRPATTQGMPIRVVDKESFEKLSNELVKLINSREMHTVSPIELSQLNAELASARLQLNLFKDKAEKASFAEKTLKGDVTKMKRLLEEESKARSLLAAQSLIKDEEAKEELKKFKLEAGKLKSDLASAKTSKDLEKVKDLESAKEENAKRIQQLNNTLQESNKVKAEHRATMQRYQDQLVKLTNELNIAQAQLSTGIDRGTFAQIAAASGTTAKNIYSDIRKVLSDRTKFFLNKARESDSDDVKNRAHWLSVALKNTNNAILTPYKVLVSDIEKDLKITSYHSRKWFAPIIDALLDTFSGRKDQLSVQEVSKMLEDLDTKKIKLRKPLQDKGYETLFDFIEAGGQLESLGIDDIDSKSDNSKAFAEVVEAISNKQNADPPPNKKVGPTPPPPPPSHGTVYRWCRRKVVAALCFLTEKSGDSEPDRWSIRTISYLRRKAGLFGAVCALPIAFLSFVTGSWW
jgi:uncharacterized coiled-coil protein SlyX